MLFFISVLIIAGIVILSLKRMIELLLARHYEKTVQEYSAELQEAKKRN